MYKEAIYTQFYKQIHANRVNPNLEITPIVTKTTPKH